MIAFDLRMYEYILLFFQLFVGFKIFHSKLREEEKEKGLWIFGTLLIGTMVTGLFFPPGETPSLQN